MQNLEKLKLNSCFLFFFIVLWCKLVVCIYITHTHTHTYYMISVCLYVTDFKTCFLAYRLENTLNYGLERVWAVGYMKGSRRYVSHL
jgi:hypothetical protein